MSHKHCWNKIGQLSDGVLKSREIAELMGNGCTAKYVQKVWNKHPEMKRPAQAPPVGECNPSWRGGRSLGKDGYVQVSVPAGHPYAKYDRPDRSSGRMYEHRMVMENKLGRYLLPSEIVDHIDRCTLHNAPENLRLFSSNQEHLSETLKGHIPEWSGKGYQRMNQTRKERLSHAKVDIHAYRKKSGGVRILQILRGHALLGKDSPYLLRMERYLGKDLICPDHFLNSRLEASEYLKRFYGHLWYPE